jgi:hypothetical protein
MHLNNEYILEVRMSKSRKELEKIRDSFKSGDWVQVVKSTWDRPNKIGRMGQIVEEKDQYTPNVRVAWGIVKGGKIVSGFSDTFSPDDIIPCPRPDNDAQGNDLVALKPLANTDVSNPPKETTLNKIGSDGE